MSDYLIHLLARCDGCGQTCRTVVKAELDRWVKAHKAHK